VTCFADLETPLVQTARFPVEPPDGRRDVTEIARQTAFRRLMRAAAPTVFVAAIPNAGKRNPTQARREGIIAGLPDLTCWWNRGHALVEMKGYDARGRAGKLSSAQIEIGNRLLDLGWPVACFFTPERAVEWLASLGAPVRRFS
jgi:hypothetical protein